MWLLSLPAEFVILTILSCEVGSGKAAAIPEDLGASVHTQCVSKLNHNLKSETFVPCGSAEPGREATPLLVSDQLPGYIVKIKINGGREWKTVVEELT